jgi:excisionase family DNA binding protein
MDATSNDNRRQGGDEVGETAEVLNIETPLTLAEAARLAGYSAKTLRRKIDEGHLRATIPAGCTNLRIKPSDLRAWMEGRDPE